MSTETRPFRVVALTGRDAPSTALAVRRVIERPGIRLAGVVREGAAPPVTPRVGSPLRRLIFPDDTRSLSELCAREGVPYVVVDSLDSPEALRQVTALEADLGIVPDGRLLGRRAFAVPRLGTLGVQRGDYQGDWAAFWALYEGERWFSLEIRHVAAAALDGEAVVLEEKVPISPRENVQSLTVKLEGHGAALLAMVDASRGGHYLGPNVVAITFDDGYADNCENAAPILEHFGLSATFFVSAGLVDTAVPFSHDGKSPHQFRNLTWSQVGEMAARGFEIGSHGWVHRNLAKCSLDEAHDEITRSRAAIEARLRIAPRSFAYPFGGERDITPEVVREVRRAGFQMIASAYGGTNLGRLDPENVLRVGVSEAFDPIALRASVEGITIQAIKREVQRWLGRRGVMGAGGRETSGMGTRRGGQRPR
jgi:peptidoglycan/xylan/chitin deacetylase (PgdA/CDA1 family)